MMKVADIAKRLNCAPSTVYELVESGQLPAYRIGLRRGGIRVTEEQLQEYLQACESRAAAAQPRPPRTRLKHLKL